jgi:hypothetical protein
MHAIHQPVRPLDQLADLVATELGYDATRHRELARLIQAMREAVDQILGIDRGGKADILGDRRELGDGVLRPAERAH